LKRGNDFLDGDTPRRSIVCSPFILTPLLLIHSRQLALTSTH